MHRRARLMSPTLRKGASMDGRGINLGGTPGPELFSGRLRRKAYRRAGRSFPGAGSASHGEGPMPRGLSGPAGEAVAGRAREGRLVAVGTKRLREHPAGSLAEFDALDRGPDPRPLRGVSGDQRGCLVKTRQRGARQVGPGQSRTHAMDCRGLRGSTRTSCKRPGGVDAAMRAYVAADASGCNRLDRYFTEDAPEGRVSSPARSKIAIAWFAYGPFGASSRYLR